ncbi:hypothetical protein M5K25_009597 [Dendrobium thyrsiflorum]|uniref:Uncharacterized protein n=1 Tax=Dendrobium thyrsiflorum TaxID=117978 RepID=A0ABD0V603_DENTH
MTLLFLPQHGGEVLTDSLSPNLMQRSVRTLCHPSGEGRGPWLIFLPHGEVRTELRILRYVYFQVGRSIRCEYRIARDPKLQQTHEVEVTGEASQGSRERSLSEKFSMNSGVWQKLDSDPAECRVSGGGLAGRQALSEASGPERSQHALTPVSSLLCEKSINRALILLERGPEQEEKKGIREEEMEETPPRPPPESARPPPDAGILPDFCPASK